MIREILRYLIKRALRLQVVEARNIKAGDVIYRTCGYPELVIRKVYAGYGVTVLDLQNGICIEPHNLQKFTVRVL